MTAGNNNNGKRVLGFWTSTSLVAGNMIGSGIFLLPSALAVYGGISLFGWIFTAAGALFLSLVFVSLSRRSPKIGGPYVYARQGFGDFSGFIVAYGYWVSILCGNAAIAVALVSYLAAFFPILSESPLVGALTALANLWLLTIVNLIGVKLSGKVQVVSTILKLLPLLFIAIFGIFYFDPQNFTPLNISSESSFSAITASAALTLWAFLGLESATIPADNIKSPEKTIPRATVAGTLLVSFIYIFATAAIMGIIPPAKLAISTAPFADAGALVWGSQAGYIIAAAGVIACFGALNGWILLQGQMPLAVALDGLFPKKFSALSKKGTPAFAIIISSVIVSFLLLMNYHKGLVDKFTFVILLATLATLVPYLYSSLAELKFLYRERNIKKFIGKTIAALLAFAYSAWAVYGLGFETIVWGVIFLSSGIPIYRWMKINPVN